MPAKKNPPAAAKPPAATTKSARKSSAAPAKGSKKKGSTTTRSRRSTTQESESEAESSREGSESEGNEEDETTNDDGLSSPSTALPYTPADTVTALSALKKHPKRQPLSALWQLLTSTASSSIANTTTITTTNRKTKAVTTISISWHDASPTPFGVVSVGVICALVAAIGGPNRLQQPHDMPVMAPIIPCTVALGLQPIQLAAFAGRFDVVKTFVEQMGADPRAAAVYGNAVHCAAVGWRGMASLETVRYLIEVCHCDPNRADKSQFTALHLAARQGNVAIVAYLIDEGHCDVNALDSWGAPILHLVLEEGSARSAHFSGKVVSLIVTTMRVLLDRGADPTVPSAMGVGLREALKTARIRPEVKAELEQLFDEYAI